MENRNYYIYRHIRLDTNEVFYVGLGSYQKDKYKRAYAKSKKCRTFHWHNIVKKGGYKVQIMLEDLTEQEAIEKEIELIALYGRSNLNKGTLINLTDGGDGIHGFIFTEQERKKRSNIQKNLYANGYVNPNKGKRFVDNPNYISPNKGKKASIEKIEKFKKNHPSKKEGYINPCLGIKKTIEQIEKNRKAQIKRYENPEERKKISDGLKKAYANGYINATSKEVINVQNGFVYNSSKEAFLSTELKCTLAHFSSMLAGRKVNKTNYEYVDNIKINNNG